MKISSIDPIELGAVDWQSYDVAFFASGFEGRSTHIFKKAGALRVKPLILGFPTDLETLQRAENDVEFSSSSCQPFIASDLVAYEMRIRQELQSASDSVGRGRQLRIFVDYSVMTRSWYGHILTWLKYSGECSTARVDFFYSHGRYEQDFEPLHITELGTVPGFEGACAGARHSVALFGLGFDKYATLAVYDQVEPDAVVCFIAQDSLGDENATRVIKANSEIIALSVSGAVALPLANTKDAFRLLYEQTTRFKSGEEILIVPMGPKPHVLASLLLAQTVPEVTCLHAKGSRRNPVPVTPTGVVSGSRVVYA